MKKTVTALAFVLLSLPCRAADHLAPEPSIYGGDAFMSDYDKLVVSVLHDAYDRDVAVRMIAVPSFSPELAVGLKGAPGGSYQIFTLQPAVQLWGYESLRMLKSGEIKVIQGNANKDVSDLEARLPPDPQNVKVASCHANIDSSTAERIRAVWEKMLRETHFDKQETMGLDGETFHFSMRVKNQFLAGQAWTPAADTAAGMLVTLAMAIKDHCDKRSNESLTNLDHALSQLAGKLN